jgi:hypothetical protein
MLTVTGMYFVLSAAPANMMADDRLQEKPSFNRDIQPILSDKCFKCHGPDKAARKSDLRLDVEAGAFADLGGYRAIEPGQPAKSELIRRITSDDDDERMPPPKADRKLDAREMALLRKWIDQGAQWQKHWSFIPPKRPAIPTVPDKSKEWGDHPIDDFVLERLRKAGLEPSPRASKETLVRRVTLDLTGLPPIPAEIDAFLTDRTPGAFEKVIDRLLSSPAYGEQMARRWLDAARYADTSGYQNDGPRYMWRWRDWVIDAYNANKPFDEFTVEQIAGDMLPDATLAQRIATGFNRNHRGNSEGGVIPEEYAVEYVVDRVETTSTVWLGLSMGCARCHDHKYDPFSQREFYQLFAYFNNVPENGRAVKEGNSPPFIKAPTPDQAEALRNLEARELEAERHFASLRDGLLSAQRVWENEHRSGEGGLTHEWTVSENLSARFELDGESKAVSFEGGAAAYGPGVLGKAAKLDGATAVIAGGGDAGKFGYFDKFSIAAWVNPESNGINGTGTIVSRMANTARATGYSIHLENGKVQVNLVKRWLDDSIRVESKAGLALNEWSHVTVTYDGSRVADGIRVYVNGRPLELAVHLDGLNQSFVAEDPFRIGAGNNNFHGRIDDVRIYTGVLTGREAAILATPESINEIIRVPLERRSPGQSAKLESCFLDRHAPDRIRDAHRHLASLRKAKVKRLESIPTVMVMEEMPVPRATSILLRGQYDKPGERVEPAIPAILLSQPDSKLGNRLDLARWLVAPANPLAARVAVNRYWKNYFGTGLVKTMEDFGSQGERPSHPDLLDWLAVEFVESGWDVKATQKRIVMSATYQQSSRVSKDLLARDSENRLLARGPRARLSAEAIRDLALSVSGLLVSRLGGPSVKPYQPQGLWGEIASDKIYEQSTGAGLYRRSLYTYWKRTVTPPTMAAFDATSRETCTVKRSRTNTPLQALALMNDVTFVEAALALAARTIRDADETPSARIAMPFRLATGRQPEPNELTVLMGNYRFHRSRFQHDAGEVELLLQVGSLEHTNGLNTAELAAYAAVANLILNLDEAISK